MEKNKYIKVDANRDENGWGLPIYDGYLEFPRQDESGIAVHVQDHARSIMPHRHYYHELALIVRGNGTHIYQQEDPVPLLPGDVLMIDPHVMHSYFVDTPMTLINCQFFTRRLNLEFNERKQIGKRIVETVYEEPIVLRRWNELGRATNIHWNQYADSGEMPDDMPVRRRGIISLSVDERREMERMCLRLIDEQKIKDADSNADKSLLLQYMLTWLKRIVNRQNAVYATRRMDTRQQKVQDAITYIEEHLSENIEVGDLAELVFWSEGYFRAVFKEITGLSPLQYINRKKIMKSIDFIEKNHMNVQEAAEMVGIYDPSYYSRLFRRHMGYSPREIRRSD